MPSPQTLLTNKVKFYAQRQVIDWEANHLPPKTQIYLFINGQPYSEYAAPLGGTLGDAIITDDFGVAKGQLTIPRNAEDKILLGEIRLTFADNPTNLAATSFSADSTFYAMGLEEQFDLDQGGTRTTRQPVPISRIPGSSIVEGTSTDRNTVLLSERLDLVAQTFEIDGSRYPQGIFLSSIDLFFASKDNSLPIALDIRKTISGVPVSSEYMSGSYVQKYPDQVNLPTQDVINALALPSVAQSQTEGVQSVSTLAKQLVAYLDSLVFSDVYYVDHAEDVRPIIAYQYTIDSNKVLRVTEVATGNTVNLNNEYFTTTPAAPGYLIKRKNPRSTYSLTKQSDGTYLDPRNNNIYSASFTAGVNFTVRNGVLYEFVSSVPNTVDVYGVGDDGSGNFQEFHLDITDFGNSLLAEAGVPRYLTNTRYVDEVLFNTRTAVSSTQTAVYAKSDRRWGTFMNNYAVWEANIYAANFSRSYTIEFPETKTYKFEYSVDNAVSIYLDGELIANNSGFGSSFTFERTISAGNHTLSWNATNSGDVGGFGLVISYQQFVGVQLTTETTGGLLGSGEFPATNFKFSHPIYLQPGTYAFCLKTNSDAYNLATSRYDLPLVGNSDLRRRETLTGNLFRATNIGGRLPDQNEDLAFVLNKYRFDTGIRSLILNSKAPDSSFRYDAFKLRSTSLEFAELAYTKALVNHTDIDGISGLLEDVVVDKIVPLRTRKRISAAGDSSIELIMASNNPDISPLVDKEKLVGVMLRNEIDPYEVDTSAQELTPAEGVARARYVSKIVTLEPGFDSNGIEVRVDVNRKVGTDIEVYAKVLSANDPETMAKRPWKRMKLVSNDGTKKFVGYSELQYVTEYYQALTPDLEYEATSLDNTPGLYQDFNRYMIKVVFYSNNPVYVPKIRNLFASACIDVPSAVISALGPSTTTTGLKLADLADVSDNPPGVGQTIVWDGNQWIPTSASEGGSLGDLADVDTTATAGPAGATTPHNLIWSPSSQKWVATASSGSSGGSGSAEDTAQLLSFGIVGDTPFVPAKNSPAGVVMAAYPHTMTYIPYIQTIPMSTSVSYQSMGYDAVVGYQSRPVRTMTDFGRNFVDTRFTNIADLRAQGDNVVRQTVVGIELLSSLRAQFGTRYGPYYWPRQGTPHTGAVNANQFPLVIRQPAYFVTYDSETSGAASSLDIYCTSDDGWHMRADATNTATIYNPSDTAMEVYVNHKMWNWCDQPIGRYIYQYNRSTGGAGDTGYVANILDNTPSIAWTGTRGDELAISVVATVPPRTISDFKFSVNGAQTGFDDFIFLIDWYVSFKGWV